MSSLLVKPNGQQGTVIDITPENARWSFVGFKLVKLRPGDIFKFQTEGREYCLVPITGAFDASTNEIHQRGRDDKICSHKSSPNTYLSQKKPE